VTSQALRFETALQHDMQALERLLGEL